MSRNYSFSSDRFGEKYTTIKLPTGCYIVIGEIFHGHTAHHFIEIIMTAKGYKPCAN